MADGKDHILLRAVGSGDRLDVRIAHRGGADPKTQQLVLHVECDRVAVAQTEDVDRLRFHDRLGGTFDLVRLDAVSCQLQRGSLVGKDFRDNVFGAVLWTERFLDGLGRGDQALG